MKRLTFILSLLFAVAFATSKDNFVLNVINQDAPVREVDGVVVVPFDSEYELLIKNENDRRCVATVWIDGTEVSSYGGFIIDANGKLNLERFVTESLTEGKRFKFVTLDNPAVDDPTRKENGIVKVEFKLEKKRQLYYISPYYPIELYLDSCEYLPVLTPCDRIYFNGNYMILDGDVITLTSSNIIFPKELVAVDDCCSNTMPGATVAGSKSDQHFYEVNFDAEDKTVILTLKIMGV